uniref:Chitin-binding type-2 domain-containing protein n=1 Tax=Parascaris equorum TaxID=6256 RepID=A0A914RWM8_PAREQ
MNSPNAISLFFALVAEVRFAGDGVKSGFAASYMIFCTTGEFISQGSCPPFANNRYRFDEKCEPLETVFLGDSHRSCAIHYFLCDEVEIRWQWCHFIW